MKHKQIRFDDGDVRANLTIVKASYDLDIERQGLIDAALAQEPTAVSTTPGAEIYRRNARAFVLPSLITATDICDLQQLAAPGVNEQEPCWITIPWPFAFEALLNLPADLIDLWLETVYELNPRWDPSRKVDEAAREKKAPISTAG
jgi:hypothetical protein